jgi:hypothetical protein
MLGLLVLASLAACDSGPAPLTEEERTAIADSAKTLVQGVFANVNNRNLEGAFAVYSSDADTRFVENGTTKTLAKLKKDNVAFLARAERMKITPASMDVVVVGPEAALVSSNYRMSFTPNGRKPFSTTGAISFVVQRRNGAWQVVQSHESELNVAGIDKAIASAKAKPSQPPVRKPVARKPPAKKPAVTRR